MQQNSKQAKFRKPSAFTCGTDESRKPSASRKLFDAPLPNSSCTLPRQNSSAMRRGGSVSTRSNLSSSRETSENRNGVEEKENCHGSRAIYSKLAKLSGSHSNSAGVAPKAVGGQVNTSSLFLKAAFASTAQCTASNGKSDFCDVAQLNEIITSNPHVRVRGLDENVKIELTNEGEAVSRKRKATGEEYDVDKVLAVWFDKRSPPSFLIKWANYPYEVCTWEWKVNVRGCTVKIREYSERQQVRMLIANELHRPEEKQGFRLDGAYLYESTAFYPCHMWEDEMNEACRTAGLAPICVENWVDSEAKPKNFTYITRNIIPVDTRNLFVPLPKLEDCRCGYGECGSSEDCCPKQFNMAYGYTPAGRLRSTFNKLENQIVECCDGCGCGPHCPTKVVQRGRQISVMIFRTLEKGWGIRTMEKIKKNSFVMEYLGIVLDVESAPDKKSAVYQFNMGPFKKPKFLIEAANFGNEARFVNHSCDPNLYAEPVFADRFDNKYLRIAYFASRDVEKGEELSIDYRIVDSRGVNGPRANGAKRTQRSCFCRSTNCNGQFM